MYCTGNSEYGGVHAELAGEKKSTSIGDKLLSVQQGHLRTEIRYPISF